MNCCSSANPSSFRIGKTIPFEPNEVGTGWKGKSSPQEGRNITAGEGMLLEELNFEPGASQVGGRRQPGHTGPNDDGIILSS